MRTLPNGDIIFPQRGKPPKIVPGYYQDDKDVWLWHPDVDDCKYREKLTINKPCRNDPRGYKEQVIIRCKYFNEDISLARCQNCDVEPKS